MGGKHCIIDGNDKIVLSANLRKDANPFLIYDLWKFAK